jgi:hypothetical protein
MAQENLNLITTEHPLAAVLEETKEPSNFEEFLVSLVDHEPVSSGLTLSV